MEVEPLIIIPVFLHDFLCIHPFTDGNGRMSRLLTPLLLCRSGFYVGKYISLEAKITKSKDLYYDVLGQTQIGWHKGTEDVILFIKYLLGIILSAYKDLEDRFALVETKLPALETVRRPPWRRSASLRSRTSGNSALRSASAPSRGRCGNWWLPGS